MVHLRQIRVLLSFLVITFLSSTPAESPAQTLDELYKKAVAEGIVNFYGTLAQVNAEKILPAFEKKFPGIKINHVDITSDNLVARAVTEARGGKTVGDVFQSPLVEKLTDSLGSDFYIQATRIKPYACCGAIIPEIDAVRQILQEHPVKPADVKTHYRGGRKSRLESCRHRGS